MRMLSMSGVVKVKAFPDALASLGVTLILAAIGMRNPRSERLFQIIIVEPLGSADKGVD